MKSLCASLPPVALVFTTDAARRQGLLASDDDGLASLDVEDIAIALVCSIP